MRVLLVEDEKPLSAAVCKLLRQEHFEVDPVYTGPDGLDAALDDIYDAVILDVMLPGMDGFAILREMRRQGKKTPVLMLTARGAVEDRVQGLESGADYYLPKPFQTSELVACLHAITRRRAETPVMALSWGGIRLNQGDARLECEATGQSVKLGAKEYQLLECFLRNPGQILGREQLIERVWGYEGDAEYNNLEVYISFVRKKLAFVGANVRIRAARGLGYSMEADHEA